MSTEPEKIADKRSALDKLDSGLLMQYFHRQIEESAYNVLDRITYGHLVLQDRHSYSSEIRRVIMELSITAKLLEQITIDDEIEINGNIIRGEDLINYYTGVFFGLVHQAKDKVLRLIDLMAAADDAKTPYQASRKINPVPLLRKHGEIINQIGIKEHILAWDQDGDSAIAVILKKRSHHEHYTSNIQNDKDLQNLRMSRTMLSPEPSKSFNEAGIAYMKKLGDESFEKYKQGIVVKQMHAITVIKENINAIAQSLTDHYGIPTSYKEQAELANEWVDYLSSLDIKNETSIEKFADNEAITLDELLEMAQGMKDNIVSMYGVGSLFRDEFNPGSSDANTVIISKTETILMDNEMPVTMRIISESDFKLDEFKKDRFNIYADGVLLFGKDQKIDKKEFPKPGAELAYLLNKDSIQRLQDIKNEIEDNDFKNELTVRLLELKAIKIMLDLTFGVAMSNKPMYVSSRKLRIKHIKDVFPDQNLTLTLERLYYAKGRIVNKDDFMKLLDVFLVQAKANIEKIKQIVAGST